MKVPIQYTRLFKNVLVDYNENSMKDEDFVYIIRDKPVVVYCHLTKSIRVYKPVLYYYLFLNQIDYENNYESIRVIDLIKELKNINATL